MDKLSRKIKLVEAKRAHLFNQLQSIYDLISRVNEDEKSRNTFIAHSRNVDMIREEYKAIVDEVNLYNLELNENYVINYQCLNSFDEMYFYIKLQLDKIEPCILSTSPTASGSCSHSKNTETIKVPDIELPHFNGDIQSFPYFYETFKRMIHDNSSLTDSERVHYLISHLIGRARDVCAGLAPAAENYKIIWQALLEKYRDTRALGTAYLNQLFSLKPAGPSPMQIDSFIDKFATLIAAFRKLDIPDHEDFIFAYMGLKVLDAETAKAYEMSIRGSNSMPKYNEFISFVREQVKVLQRTAQHSDNPESRTRTSHTRTHRDSRVTTVASRSSTSRAPHTFLSTQPVSPGNGCILCQDNSHMHLYDCNRFLSVKPRDRYTYVKEYSACINCLSLHHIVRNCKSRLRCRKCNDKHHTLLHFENKNTAQCASTHTPPPAVRSALSCGPGSIPVPPLNNNRTDDVALCTLSDNNNKIVPRVHTTVLLATARILIVDSQGNEHSVRALLDSASQSNFITRNCCDRLGLHSHQNPSCSIVKGIGGSSKITQGSVHIQFYSRFNKNIKLDMDALVVDKITERLPSVTVDVSLLTNFRNLPLADNTYQVPGDIDVLVGAAIFPHLLLSDRVHCESIFATPHAIETVLGYVIVGSAPVKLDTYSTVSYCCFGETLENAIHKFWELEEVDMQPILSPDDKESEDIYHRTTTRGNDGRYTVSLPFKGDPSTLGDSRRLAERCFLCLERKMQASPKLKQAYDNVIREYLENEYISPVSPETKESTDLPSYIIPHHGVIREDKLTSKLRVVLNASARSSTSVSLNDILYNGQNLQGNLFNIIINFRLFSVAISADIRQMFLCIGVRESDRRFQRILYRFSPDEPLKVYQFNRVCFGLKSSPFHALRTIKQLASDEGESFPRAREIIETGLYMDDLVYSLDSEEEAISSASEIISLMKAGQFDLVKWTSNSQSVLDSIPPSHRLSSVKRFDELDTHKILGLNWSHNSDLFNLKICKPAYKCTKRTILSCVARLWDVMGFVAPVILFAKLLIKELWCCNCDWDEAPPDNITLLWSRFREELPLLEQIAIPRHVSITKSSEVTIIGFADASERAYGGVVYFHVKNNDVNTVHLMSAKSKVAPHKMVSLARLELCAVFLLAKLINNIINTCNNRISFKDVYAFSDSTVALCWVHASPHRWDTFVANRVAKIQSLLSTQCFRHVPGIENPADCLSRGLSPAQIIDHPLWFHGPPWITTDPSEWPVDTFHPSSISNPPEEKKHSLIACAPLEESPFIALANRVSSWSKLLRCVVYTCRFIKRLPLREFITAADLNYAELRVLREIQVLFFSDEIIQLQSGKPCRRTFQRLKPFLHDGIIRVGGRLSNSQLSFVQKHPIVLPRKHHILNLLVDYHHKVNCHAGPDLLMSILRQRYWILSARSLIRNRIHKCLPCFRLRPKATFPEMSEHKSCRVVQSTKPFIHTGTDYAGPFRVTPTRGRGIRSIKAYICLFVCMTTRAIHIELAGDLSTASFMAAFKRFLSRRGPVGRMYSDNGTNYIGAKRTLSELHTFLTSKHYNTEFAHILSENRISWSLNTPAASHFGGNWEANVKSLKTHLFRIVGEQVLSFEEMTTVLAQIECIMNTRPLCRTLSSDPSEPLALTPAHFLHLTPLRYLPARDIDEDKLHILSRYDMLDKLVQSFWKRWRVEYLHTLQSRDKWNTLTNPVTAGTVVVLITENSPPLHWPLGVVEEVFPAADGVVRVVRVKTATGSYTRPVVRLCPLPTQ